MRAHRRLDRTRARASAPWRFSGPIAAAIAIVLMLLLLFMLSG